jgi:hypothetical protein
MSFDKMTKEQKVMAVRLLARITEDNEEELTVAAMRRNIEKADREWRRVHDNDYFMELLFGRCPAFREVMAH